MYMIMKGGSLKPQELKDFLQASYEKYAPNNINGYVQDESLSNLYGKNGKFYVDKDLNEIFSL